MVANEMLLNYNAVVLTRGHQEETFQEIDG